MMANLEVLLSPAVAAQGCEIWELGLVKEGGQRILRIYIDKPEGVSLDDCEAVSHAVSDVLDEHDPIDGAYRLQVGSPGVERTLSKPAHFSRYVGHKIAVKLYAPHANSVVTGQKKFSGVLTSFADDTVSLKDHEKQTWDFTLKDISSCKLIVFEGEGQ
jgi:ribosome maturation factor RimP